MDGRKSVQMHLQSLEKQAIAAKEMVAELINVHGGRDAWSTEEGVRFLSGNVHKQAHVPMQLLVDHIS